MMLCTGQRGIPYTAYLVTVYCNQLINITHTLWDEFQSRFSPKHEGLIQRKLVERSRRHLPMIGASLGVCTLPAVYDIHSSDGVCYLVWDLGYTRYSIIMYSSCSSCNNSTARYSSNVFPRVSLRLRIFNIIFVSFFSTHRAHFAFRRVQLRGF